MWINSVGYWELKGQYGSVLKPMKIRRFYSLTMSWSFILRGTLCCACLKRTAFMRCPGRRIVRERTWRGLR